MSKIVTSSSIDEGQSMSKIVTSSSIDEQATTHKKELKQLNDQCRNAIKVCKKTKGKKAKDDVSKIESMLKADLIVLKQRQQLEVEALASLLASGTLISGSPPSPSPPSSPTSDSTLQPQPSIDPIMISPTEIETPGLTPFEKKRLKAQQKKDKKRQDDHQREQQIVLDQKDMGPSARDVEIDQITNKYLTPRNLKIKNVDADGNCLYRSIACQLPTKTSYTSVRAACASEMLKNPDDYSAFCDCDDYDKYCETVKISNEWGGQVELKAIAASYQLPILIFESSAEPILMGEEFDDGSGGVGPLKVCFHRHYYALGEHYNCVVDDDV
jgi:OTU domain-containing protein 6